MSKLAVHFGGGALGRGLVIPLLEQSGYDVVLADVDESLLSDIWGSRGYDLDITDADEEARRIHVGVSDALSSATDQDRLSQYLAKADVVTTAVRRENLHFVASTLISVPGQSMEGKTVICAENVEHVGSFFKEALTQAADDPRKKSVAASLVTPDTVVDRICASDWPNSLVVKTEKYHELAVDSKVVPETHIALITADNNIQASFVRKRLLLNTFADASSFMGVPKGLRYLHEAVVDQQIQSQLEPYFSSFDVLLRRRYGFTDDELGHWKDLYRDRLANPRISRKLSTVARDLWRKLGLNERFVWPLIQLSDMGVDISESVAVLVQLIRASTEENDSEILARLTKLWGGEDCGRRLLDTISEMLS